MFKLTTKLSQQIGNPCLSLAAFNPFSHNHNFKQSCRRTLWKTLWEKEKNAGNQHFLLFPQCFLMFPEQIKNFQ